MTYPSTVRFFASKDPKRLNIKGEPDRVLDVWYRTTSDATPQHFGHTWDIRGWGEENEGKWTFNRSDVAIANQWWPAVYTHATLTDLLTHLESTFIEGVPANQPT